MEKRRLLVVEGADCMGKTTLVGQLHKSLGWPVTHTGGPKTDEQLEASCRYVEAMTDPTILDRTPHLSEIAYRPLSRDPVSLEKSRELVLRFRQTNPVLVLCRRSTLPDLEVVERPHKSLDYWAKVVEGYSGIVARYDHLFGLLQGEVPIFLYDWTRGGEYYRLSKWLDFYLNGEV